MIHFIKRVMVKVRKIFKKTNFIAHIQGFRYAVDLNEFIDWSAYMGTFESDTSEAFRRIIKPGMTVIDIGANSGFYTLLAAQCTRGGKVYAFEPTSYGYEKLVKNVSLNTYDSIATFKLGLSDHEYVTSIAISSSFPIDKKETVNFFGGDPVEERIEFVTLDSLGLKPDFIKLDTDGYEYKVLRGAEKTLKQGTIVLFEFYPKTLESKGDSAVKLVEYLSSLRYCFYTTKLEPISDLLKLQPTNVVAIRENNRPHIAQQ